MGVLVCRGRPRALHKAAVVCMVWFDYGLMFAVSVVRKVCVVRVIRCGVVGVAW